MRYELICQAWDGTFVNATAWDVVHSDMNQSVEKPTSSEDHPLRGELAAQFGAYAYALHLSVMRV